MFCTLGVVKPGDGGNDGDGDGSTNTMLMVQCVRGTVNLTQSRGDAAGEGVVARELEPEDFERGFVLTHIGINEVYDFTAPTNATVNADWRAHGVAEDWFYPGFPDWSFSLGTNDVNRFRVYSFGRVEPLVHDDGGRIIRSNWLSPFQATLGIVPATNWHLISAHPPSSCTTSQFWHVISPSNTLILTWQNALLNRESHTPVSFQAELWPSGRFVYRYDLSRAGGDEVTNIVIGASLGGTRSCASAHAWITNALPTNVTSVSFYPLSFDDARNPDMDNDGLSTSDELFVFGTDPHASDTDLDGISDHDEIFVHGTDPLNPHTLGETLCDGFAVKIGGIDPLSVAPGSTNTVLEHVFYSGTTNGAFAMPQSSESTAVLRVSAVGSGSGELVVGDMVVPLMGGGAASSPQNQLPESPTLLVALPRGIDHSLFLRADSSLDVLLDSDDFAYGVLPSLASMSLVGSITFPSTQTTPACIHDFNSRRREVSLPVAGGARMGALTCTWADSDGVEVENHPLRSASVKGNFPAREVRTVSYTLSHPRYLFGQREYSQTVRFCPRPPDPGPGGDDPPDPAWFDDGDDGDSDDEGYDGHWCCYWGTCDGSCGCGNPECCGGAGGEDFGDFDGTCPVHGVAYDACADLHRADYTNAMCATHLDGVLYIRNPPRYEQLQLEVPATHRNCCPCPEHRLDYVSVAYKSYRLGLVDAAGAPFVRSGESCTVNLAGLHPSSEVGDADLAFVRGGGLAESAALTPLCDVDIDDLFAGGASKAMLAFEAEGGWYGVHAGIELVVSLGGREVHVCRLPLLISPVDAFYRYVNLRGAEEGTAFAPVMPGEPVNFPDDETDGRHFVFVHGYNVNASESRDWARAMFKRLWWAGSKSKFTAVDWFGDYSQFSVPVVDEVSPNYYQNVVHAFRTAPALKAVCDALQGDKVMLAHSLGNMLVSSAAVDHGLQCAKYYMLNAAVPMEAYDGTASAAAMIDGEWGNVPASFRAANWHGLFSGTGDFRAGLKWKGRFAGIVGAVNCYSPTEDVLGNPVVGQLTLVGGVWKIQELTKGTTIWNDINVGSLGAQRVSCEGGWGINTTYALNPLWYVYQYGFLSHARTMTRQMAIEHPPFTPFCTETDAMHSTNRFAIADAAYAARLKAKFLADAIPAESFAAGANELRAETGIVSYDYQSATPNGWPSERQERRGGVRVCTWLHSDLKNVSNYYVYKLFEKIVKGE